jgi:hypothetical protein
MNFITPVELPAHLPCLRHTDHLLLLGSCFAANMGARFTEAKFSCDVNPYGVLYNPLSISATPAGRSVGSPFAIRVVEP